MVDGQHIPETAFVFHQTKVSVGSHDIGFIILRPWTFPFQSGGGDIHVTLAAGQNYVLRVSMPAPSVTPDGQASSWANQCEVWVETSDGKPVTPQVAAMLQLPQPGPVPIFIPVH